MTAEASQEPGIVKGEDHGHLPAQPGQNAQIEIAAMQVMAMDKVRPPGRQVKQMPGCGKAVIVEAANSV
jgi:hypothetical protein